MQTVEYSSTVKCVMSKVKLGKKGKFLVDSLNTHAWKPIYAASLATLRSHSNEEASQMGKPHESFPKRHQVVKQLKIQTLGYQVCFSLQSFSEAPEVTNLSQNVPIVPFPILETQDTET